MEETKCYRNWGLLPLRVVLGLMFLSAGIPKLISLFSGSPALPNFFASLGIPLPAFFSWVVAIVEAVGGLLLLLGLWQFWIAVLLSVIMIVAALTTSVFPGFDHGLLTKHLAWIGGLLAVMFFNNNYMSLDAMCCKGSSSTSALGLGDMKPKRKKRK